LLLLTAALLLAIAVPLSGSIAIMTSLAGVAVLVALECPAARRLVPPSLAVVGLAPALIVTPAGDRIVAAVTVLVVSSAASWWGSVVTPASRRVNLLWLTPICGAAWFAAGLWDELGHAGWSVFVAVMVVALGAVAACGAPPWRSRFVGRWSAAHLAARVPTLFMLFGGAAAALGTASMLPGRAADHVAVAAGTSLQIVLAMGLVTIRQWRFAPVGRRRAAALLVVTAVASTLVIAAWPGWPVALAVAMSLVVTWRLTRPLARLAQQAAPSADALSSR
jgi:hypothetical protein